MVRVVNRWREMAADVALGAASLVSMMTSGGGGGGCGGSVGPPGFMSNCGGAVNEDISSPHSSSVTANYGHGGYGRLREFTDEESNMCLLFNRVVDMENPERHTVYLVVSLFVTFLSNKNSTPTDEKANAKKQSLVFRHFNTLLGYSSTEKCFTIPPARLRKSAVCNAFISGLPEILDMNLHTGNQLLPTIAQLLIHLPSPQKLASDQNVTNYSLALLTQHMRHLWLQSLILILYKYRFDQVPVSENVVRLIGIVMKTLQNQVHECSESETFNEIDTWDEVEDDDFVDRPEPNRPESLAVTTIQEDHTQSEGLVQAVRVNQPTIVEPGVSYESPMSRKRSTAIQELKRKKSAIEAVKKSVLLRCGHCNEPIETFDEETMSLCLIALETFLHREPAMAAPILFKILYAVTRLIDTPMYPWHSTEMFVPANSRSVAKQMLRVSLHHLSTSAICLQLFDTKIPRAEAFWSVIALSLADFNELSPVYFIQILMEDLDESWPGSVRLIMKNLAFYAVQVPTDMYITHWSNLTGHMETFFRRYHTAISADNSNSAPTRAEIENVLIVMGQVLKVQNFSAFKSAVSLVESFAKWLSESLHGAEVSLEALLGVCTACNRALIRERDKQCVTRSVVTELMQAIKFKAKLQEANYITVANMVLLDAGEDIEVPLLDDQFNTAASEAIRPFLFEVLDFIADLHVIAKLKKETNSDALGGDLKVKLAEAIAVEMSRSNARDCRTVIRFIPWLMSPPSVTQAAPGAFADSVTNVRVLSWLLLGALHANHSCLPVPIECSQHMADYIHFVLAGFADQSKQSVVHMSALFHAFHLCQLWTVYCERAATYSSTTAFAHLVDFWARVTPAILQLLSHSKVLADMVNLHFLNTIQALQQVNSALLCQLYSMWAPILTAYHSQIPNQLRMKLDSCQNQPSLEAPLVTEWLKKVRYKISQVELQTSAASPYYTV
uniref:Protein unc-79 homolog n=1 Tax=Caenorhabditis japonica TaxID=281687 RepID=A0A8R1IIT9_CAEJA